MNRIQIYLIALFLFILSPITFALATQDHFISITDIHFNPFNACTTSPCKIIQDLNSERASQWKNTLDQQASKTIVPYGKDANYALLKSALSELQSVAKQSHPKFVILIGDYLGHNYQDHYKKYSGDQSQQGYQAFVQKTLQFLTNEIRMNIPNIPVYPAVGNNDSYNGDYYSNPNGPFYRNTAHAWAAFFLNDRNRTNFLNEFPTAGYYSVTPSDARNQRIIVLNTVLFSMKAKGQGVAAAAQSELNWLKQQLAEVRANQQKVWLVFHIPVGIDVFKTISTGQTTSLWQSTYTQEFMKLLSQYDKSIAGIFTSHLHMDAFALFKHNDGIENFDSFTPAISPMFGNNSGFKLFAYNNDTFQVNDFVTYYLPINSNATNRLRDQQWQALYDFNNKYQPACSNNCVLMNGMNNLQENNSLVQDYKLYYAVGNPNSQPINTDAKDWPYYWCAISHFTQADYESCISSL